MRRRAFTLLELMLVLAIIAIIVGMAVPSMHAFGEGRRTNQCADQILALTHYARTQAITNGVPYRLNLNPYDGTYWLTMQQLDGRFYPPPTSLGQQQYKAPDNVRLSWNAPVRQEGQYIEFESNGRTDPSEIQVTDKERQQFIVGCLSATEMYKILTPQEQQLYLQSQQQK